ncbi:MAG: hypothetical protein V7K41_23790 [Nostoc sp.]|uniref:hypothetical protein n=1 Tax=Nostoc sp. TaxID=1180 RepID=UPI002FF4D7C7
MQVQVLPIRLRFDSLSAHEQERKLRTSGAGCTETRTSGSNREVRGIIPTIDSTKSLRALRDLCLIQYGIQAIGNPADKASYINALLTFPVIACKQVSENKGLKSPMLSQVEALEATLEAMGIPTPEQSALLKVTMEGS